jgi:hypothetical protein
MWRAAASMELIPAGTRTQLGDALIKEPRQDYIFWCLSRLGARKLFYGPANQVLPASVASRWIEALIPVPKSDDALIALARRTGDPVRDIAATAFAAVKARLADPELLEKESDERALGRIFGEDLPSGLVLR